MFPIVKIQYNSWSFCCLAWIILMASEFVHLHNHSDYSLLDGAQNIDVMLDTVLELEYG